MSLQNLVKAIKDDPKYSNDVSEKEMNQILKELYPDITGEIKAPTPNILESGQIHKNNLGSHSLNYSVSNESITKEMIINCYNEIIKRRRKS